MALVRKRDLPKPAQASPDEKTSATGAFMSHLGNNITLGGGAHAVAFGTALKEVAFGDREGLIETYRQNLLELDKYFEQASSEHPVASGSGAVAGMFGSALIPGAVGAKVLSAVPKLASLGTATRAAIGSGAAGLIATTADIGLTEQRLPTIWETALGTVFGAVIPVAGSGLKKLATAGRGRLLSKTGEFTDEGKGFALTSLSTGQHGNVAPNFLTREGNLAKSKKAIDYGVKEGYIKPEEFAIKSPSQQVGKTAGQLRKETFQDIYDRPAPINMERLKDDVIAGNKIHTNQLNSLVSTNSVKEAINLKERDLLERYIDRVRTLNRGNDADRGLYSEITSALKEVDNVSGLIDDVGELASDIPKGLHLSAKDILALKRSVVISKLSTKSTISAHNEASLLELKRGLNEMLENRLEKTGGAETVAKFRNLNKDLENGINLQHIAESGWSRQNQLGTRQPASLAALGAEESSALVTQGGTGSYKGLLYEVGRPALVHGTSGLRRVGSALEQGTTAFGAPISPSIPLSATAAPGASQAILQVLFPSYRDGIVTNGNDQRVAAHSVNMNPGLTPEEKARAINNINKQGKVDFRAVSPEMRKSALRKLGQDQ